MYVLEFYGIHLCCKGLKKKKKEKKSNPKSGTFVILQISYWSSVQAIIESRGPCYDQRAMLDAEQIDCNKSFLLHSFVISLWNLKNVFFPISKEVWSIMCTLWFLCWKHFVPGSLQISHDFRESRQLTGKLERRHAGL